MPSIPLPQPLMRSMGFLVLFCEVTTSRFVLRPPPQARLATGAATSGMRSAESCYDTVCEEEERGIPLSCRSCQAAEGIWIPTARFVLLSSRSFISRRGGTNNNNNDRYLSSTAFMTGGFKRIIGIVGR